MQIYLHTIRWIKNINNKINTNYNFVLNFFNNHDEMKSSQINTGKLQFKKHALPLSGSLKKHNAFYNASYIRKYTLPFGKCPKNTTPLVLGYEIWSFGIFFGGLHEPLKIFLQAFNP
jgi:hypothetical protein